MLIRIPLKKHVEEGDSVKQQTHYIKFVDQRLATQHSGFGQTTSPICTVLEEKSILEEYLI